MATHSNRSVVPSRARLPAPTALNAKRQQEAISKAAAAAVADSAGESPTTSPADSGNSIGAVMFAGDLSGDNSSQTVVGIQGSQFTNAPTAGEIEVPQSNGDGTLSWVLPSASGTGTAGQGGNTKQYGEVPSGAIDGTNVTFTLANPPDPGAALALELNGLDIVQGTDYTLSGNTITMAYAPQPQSGARPSDSLYAREYVYNGPGYPVYDEVPVGAVNGTNTVFTLANTPNPSASLDIELNGLPQRVGIDFTLSGANITFITVPQAGDSVYARFYAY